MLIYLMYNENLLLRSINVVSLLLLTKMVIIIIIKQIINTFESSKVVYISDSTWRQQLRPLPSVGLWLVESSCRQRRKPLKNTRSCDAMRDKLHLLWKKRDILPAAGEFIMSAASHWYSSVISSIITDIWRLTSSVMQQDAMRKHHVPENTQKKY